MVKTISNLVYLFEERCNSYFGNSPTNFSNPARLIFMKKFLNNHWSDEKTENQVKLAEYFINWYFASNPKIRPKTINELSYLVKDYQGELTYGKGVGYSEVALTELDKATTGRDELEEYFV